MHADAAVAACRGRCWRCRHVGHEKCRVRKCACGVERWGGDVFLTLLGNLGAVDDELRLVVTTAPGADVLPWSDRCGHAERGEVCSGPKGCRVDALAATAWERTYERRRDQLWRAIAQQLRREGLESPFLARVDEDHQRGVAHINWIFRNDVAGRRATVLLAEMGAKYGFGFTDRRPKVRGNGRGCAAYLSGYLRGGARKHEAATMKARVGKVRCRARVWAVSPKLTKRTGVTMSSLCRGRRLHASRAGLCERPAEGLAVTDWAVIDCASGELVRNVWEVLPSGP
jgi:hypothetical protein